MNGRKASVLFDGYPRTREQACQLKDIFAELDMSLHGVIAIMVHPENLIKRITARRTCSTCNSIVNLALDPLNSFHDCPACGGKLVQREDDNEAVVRRRIEGYHHETEPLLEYYKERGVLYCVEGMGSVNEVRDRIERVLLDIDRNSPMDPDHGCPPHIGRSTQTKED